MNISVEYWGWVIAIAYLFWVLGIHGVDRRDLWVSRMFAIFIGVGVLTEALFKFSFVSSTLPTILWMVIMGTLLIGGVPGLRYRTDKEVFHALTYHGAGALGFAVIWTIIGVLIIG